MQRFQLKIANWKTEFRAAFDKPALTLPKAYHAFLTTDLSPPELRLDIQHGPLPSLNDFKLVHDTKESWALFRNRDHLWFCRPSPAKGTPWTLLRLEVQTNKATIFLKSQGSLSKRKYPLFAHPMDQLLFTYWISLKPALEIHACGIGVDDFGYAFLGHSGWGKSTLARLFQKLVEKVPGTFGAPTPKRARHLPWHLLSDDRLIVAKQEKGWRLFGTPWHGDANVFSNASFPLKKIFFLRHGRQNEITPISPATAAAKLFAMSFPVLWDEKKKDHALEVASQIAAAIPAYEFAFLPDASAIDFLEKTWISKS